MDYMVVQGLGLVALGFRAHRDRTHQTRPDGLILGLRV